MGYVQYGGASVVLSASARTDTWLYLPFREQFEATVGRATVICQFIVGMSSVISPTHESCRLVSEADCSRI